MKCIHFQILLYKMHFLCISVHFWSKVHAFQDFCLLTSNSLVFHQTGKGDYPPTKLFSFFHPLLLNQQVSIPQNGKTNHPLLLQQWIHSPQNSEINHPLLLIKFVHTLQNGKPCHLHYWYDYLPPPAVRQVSKDQQCNDAEFNKKGNYVVAISNNAPNHGMVM